MENILIDFYQGAYGETIRIEVYSISQLMMIRNIIMKVRCGTMEELSFKEMDNITLNSLSDFIIKKEVEKWFSKPSYRIKETSSTPIFLWSQSNEGWEDTIGLIEGLLESDVSAKQYLINDENRMIVELVLILE